MDMVYIPNTDKVVICYQDEGNNDYCTAIVGTVSGTSISFGSENNFGDPCYNTRITYDASADKVVVAYRRKSDSHGRAAVGTISGTSISFGSETEFHGYEVSTGYVTVGAVFDSTNNVVVLAYRGRDASNNLDGYSRVIQNAATVSSSNLTATNFIGVSDAAYADGATATVQIAGSVDDAQSSLTAGQLYYVQTDGTLSTTAGFPSVLAGKAISSTKLAIKG